MTQTLQTIVDSVHLLSMKERLQLLELLEEELAQQEEEAFENDPKVTSEIHESRMQYERGEYLTIEEYIAKTRDSEH